MSITRPLARRKRTTSANDGDSARIAELISYGIAGHHTGLPDNIGGPGSLQERLKLYEADRLDPVWRSEITPDGTQLTPDFKWQLSDKSIAAFQLGFLGRMIFSCLVDADFKDTEEYFNRVEDKKADREWPPLQSILPTLLTAFNQHMSCPPKDRYHGQQTSVGNSRSRTRTG